MWRDFNRTNTPGLCLVTHFSFWRVWEKNLGCVINGSVILIWLSTNSVRLGPAEKT